MSDSVKRKLLKKIIIKGFIKTMTGLHIGGTNNGMDIGGVDNAVIRNPVTNQPYIPGSSIKGKMRSLLEIAIGAYKEVRMGKVKYGPGDDPEKLSTQLFGSARNDEHQRPSKIIVRDSHLVESDINFKLLENVQFSETKTEVVIDRITAAAMPRQLERVPAGALFNLGIVLNIFDGDDQDALMKMLLRGLMMVQDDYLGGSGSRGSGQVSFLIDEIEEKTFEFYLLEGGNDSSAIYDQGRLETLVPLALRN